MFQKSGREVNSRTFTSSIIEYAALAWFESLGYVVKHGTEIPPGEISAERSGYGQVVFEDRLRHDRVG